MKIYFYTILFSLLPFHFVAAQAFINGSFENTTAVGCTYNLSNASFNAMMSNVTAYGAGNETDIMVAGCYVPTIPDGTFCVALAAPTSDEIAIPLTVPLVAGLTYSFTFYAYADIQFRPRGDVEIGASLNNTSFGTLIYTAVTVANSWVQYTASFVAPNNATHITVRNIAGAIHWNRVDAFEFTTLLPVNVSTLKGTLVGTEVDLEWQTEQEIDTDYFVVQRSLDGLEWDDLSTVAGAGTSHSPLNYKVVDANPQIGTNYYRFRQVDLNTEEHFSNVVAIDYAPLNQQSILVYPNPTTDRIVVHYFSDETGRLDLKLYDVWGRLLLSKSNIGLKEGVNQYELDLQGFSEGIYMLKLENERMGYSVQRVVKGN